MCLIISCVPSIKPVSYTHLDVYKRQDNDRVLLKDFREEYNAYCCIKKLIPVRRKEFSTRIKSLKFEIEKEMCIRDRGTIFPGEALPPPPLPDVPF